MRKGIAVGYWAEYNAVKIAIDIVEHMLGTLDEVPQKGGKLHLKGFRTIN